MSWKELDASVPIRFRPCFRPYSFRSGTFSDGLAVPSVPEKISSSKIWPSVSGCWLYTPNDLAIDSLRCTRCSGLCCAGSGQDGNNLSFWLRRERLLVGIRLAFGCINGSPGLDNGEAERV
jgi:hypothetical protein